jgi:hypothetical protein
MDKKLVTFLDNVSRTVIGKMVSESSDFIEIENPVVVHVVPQQDPQGQMRMSLQLYPIFFREFLADKDGAVTWKYNKNTITLPSTDVTFDFKLHAQYEQLFAPVPQQAVPQQAVPQQAVPQQAVPQQGGSLKFPPQQQPVQLFDK